MAEKKGEVFFHNFLAGIRSGKNVPLERLGRGVCSAAMLARIEDGSRQPCKLTRNRLMERLGIDSDGYEDYLQADEYALWRERQTLLEAMAEGDLKNVRCSIEKYERNSEKSSCLERQFYLAMKAQVRRCEGASEDELRSLFYSALKCTVPDAAGGGWMFIPLSVKEWNLLLEYVCHGGNIGMDVEGLLSTFMASSMDIESSAKLYPKGVYYLCREKMKRSKEDWECEKLLSMCEEALGMLRDAKRSYYLYQLLETMEQLYTAYLAGSDCLSGEQLARTQSRLAQVRGWMAMMEEICGEYDISCRTQNDCHLYWQMENYKIGNVVKVRRELLGMSQKELCEGVCDAKTLRRLEKGGSKIQHEIRVEMFDKLRLSPEYQRKDIVTESHEALLLHGELSKALNHYKMEAFGRMLARLEGMLDMTERANRLEIGKLKILHACFTDQISHGECVERLRSLLERNIPLENLEAAGEAYLTCGELECLHSMAIRAEGEERERYIMLSQNLCRHWKDDNMIKAHMSIYELLMRSAASYLGDIGEYRQSDEIADRIIRESLAMGRLNMTGSCLYCRFWNRQEGEKQKGSAVPASYARRELQKCIQLARFCKQTSQERFLVEKLKHYQ